MVALPVPTTQGSRRSRETIAAWQVTPPPSVINAAARRIAGTQSGLVISATRTSPSKNSVCWSGEVRMRKRPDASPTDAARPESRSAGVVDAAVPDQMSPERGEW